MTLTRRFDYHIKINHSTILTKMVEYHIEVLHSATLTKMVRYHHKVDTRRNSHENGWISR